jgi:hypothetical protein
MKTSLTSTPLLSHDQQASEFVTLKTKNKHFKIANALFCSRQLLQHMPL